MAVNLEQELRKAQRNLREAHDEIERLRAELNQYRDAGIPATVYERNKELLRDIVKQQAEIERLRKALTDLREWYFGAEIAAVEIEQAFAALETDGERQTDPRKQ